MRKHTFEYIYMAIVFLVSATGFWELYFGPEADPNGFHHLHLISNFIWLSLIALQLYFIDSRKHAIHKRIGYAVFVIGPFIFASLALLTVYSASKAAANGTGDSLGVQNVTVTLEVGLMILLAFLFRRNVKIHGALILASALLFLGIALFFSLLSFVPAYEISGPETFENFGKAARTAVFLCTGIGAVMFLKDIRHGWPWLLPISFFYLNEYLNSWISSSDRLIPFTRFFGTFDLYMAFIASFTGFLLLLLLTWRMKTIGWILKK